MLPDLDLALDRVGRGRRRGGRGTEAEAGTETEDDDDRDEDQPAHGPRIPRRAPPARATPRHARPRSPAAPRRRRAYAGSRGPDFSDFVLRGFGRGGGDLSFCFCFCFIGFVDREFLIAFCVRLRHSSSVSSPSL